MSRTDRKLQRARRRTDRVMFVFALVVLALLGSSIAKGVWLLCCG